MGKTHSLVICSNKRERQPLCRVDDEALVQMRRQKWVPWVLSTCSAAPALPALPEAGCELPGCRQSEHLYFVSLSSVATLVPHSSTPCSMLQGALKLCCVKGLMHIKGGGAVQWSNKLEPDWFNRTNSFMGGFPRPLVNSCRVYDSLKEMADYVASLKLSDQRTHYSWIFFFLQDCTSWKALHFFRTELT